MGSRLEAHYFNITVSVTIEDHDNGTCSTTTTVRKYNTDKSLTGAMVAVAGEYNHLIVDGIATRIDILPEVFDAYHENYPQITLTA